jgi:predicted MPP superfamily phosphohydrolase
LKKSSFVIFFSIVLTVYGLVNFYIFMTGLHALPIAYYSTYIPVFLFISLSYLGGRFLERAYPSALSTVLIWMGSLWLAAMVYFLFASLLFDIVRFANWIAPFYPTNVTRDYGRFKFYLFLFTVSVVFLIVFSGYLNARSPHMKRLNIDINKNANGLKNLTIAVASDIHLGTIIGKSRIEKIVSNINSLSADLVLLPGDVVDEDIGPVIRRNLGETLRKIKSVYGVYAITGNHEYIGGSEPATKYLEEHGIVELRDRYVKIADSFYIAGREDRASKGFAGILRKPITQLLEGIDKSLPLILMDHQPVKLIEAEQNGVDLQLSGHTHHGQLWPFNFITKEVYELSMGYKKSGNTHYYVSCGAGTWGPPIRTGNRPEIVYITITFK